MRRSFGSEYLMLTTRVINTDTRPSGPPISSPTHQSDPRSRLKTERNGPDRYIRIIWTSLPVSSHTEPRILRSTLYPPPLLPLHPSLVTSAPVSLLDYVLLFLWPHRPCISTPSLFGTQTSHTPPVKCFPGPRQDPITGTETLVTLESFPKNSSHPPY